MHMLNISVLYIQSNRKLQWKLWNKLTSLCMHYLSKTRKQEKMVKFTNLSFRQKLIFWHKTSSCKCSMCLYYVGKVSDSFSQSSGSSWLPRACTIWALTKPLLRCKVLKNGYVQNAVILSKNIFMASNFFMQMFIVSTLCMQSIRWLQYKLISPCMHYLSTNKTLIKSSLKMPKFKTLSFCQKVFLWHQTSLCKCPMCLHCVYKVSGCFSKSCGTSLIPCKCTTYATLRITKGNNSNRTGP